MATRSGSCIQFDIDFPEEFQIHIHTIFPGSRSLLNTRSANAFYADLLNFEPQSLLDKKPLVQLLDEYSLGLDDGGSWALVLSKVPALFCNWWAKQMLALRSSAWNLTLHLVLLSDPFPCSGRPSYF